MTLTDGAEEKRCAMCKHWNPHDGRGAGRCSQKPRILYGPDGMVNQKTDGLTLPDCYCEDFVPK